MFLAIATAIPVPSGNNGVRRLDPSKPDEEQYNGQEEDNTQVEDFDKSTDNNEALYESNETEEEYNENNEPSSEIDDTIEIDASEFGSEDSPRQQARLEQMSARYELLNGETSELFGEIQRSEANSESIRASIKKDEADEHELANTGEWLNDEATHYFKHTEELQSEDEQNAELAVGNAYAEMAYLADRNAQIEQEIINNGEKQLELENQIIDAKNTEVNLKGQESELQLDQVYMEHELISNEKRFDEMVGELQELEEQIHEYDYDDDHYDDDASYEPEQENSAPNPTAEVESEPQQGA